MNTRWYILALALLLTSFIAQSNEKVVSVATLGDYPPFCFINHDNNAPIMTTLPPGSDVSFFTGYSWDVLRESFHIMGYTIQLTVTPWPRAVKYVEIGKVDILFPTGKNSERLKVFDYSKESINEAKFLVYVTKDNPIQWTGLESFNNLVVGIKRGFNYGDKWEAAHQIKRHEVSNIMNGFLMLDNKRISGFLGYEFNWDYLLKQHGWNKKYRKLPSFDSSREYLVSLKTNPLGPKLLSDFDKGKQILIKSGRLKEIQQQWFGSE